MFNVPCTCQIYVSAAPHDVLVPCISPPQAQLRQINCTIITDINALGVVFHHITYNIVFCQRSKANSTLLTRYKLLRDKINFRQF